MLVPANSESDETQRYGKPFHVVYILLLNLGILWMIFWIKCAAKSLDKRIL